MKPKFLITLLITTFFSFSIILDTYAGKDPEFKKVYASAFPFVANVYAASSPTGDRIIGSQQNEFCLLDGNNGKILWHHKFKDVTNGEMSSTNFQMVLWDADILLVFDNKLGKDRVGAFDLKTGENLWIKDKFKWPKPGWEGNKGGIEEMIIYIPELESFIFSQKESITLIKVDSGEEVWETSVFKGSVGEYTMHEGDLIMINYKPSFLSAIFTAFKNQLVRINPANGEIKWESNYMGFVRRTVITREPKVDLQVSGDKLMLLLDGVQVYDINTGQSIWGETYTLDLNARKGFVNSNVPGKALRAGIYGAISEPLFTDDAVYIVRGGDKQKTKYIQKLNRETGEVLWTSEKIEKANAMPYIEKVGDRIVAQIGGYINLQAVSKEVSKDSKGTTTITIHRINKYIWMGKYGLTGIDDATGKFAWRSEKFKKRIANMSVDGGTVYTASGISFYSIDTQSGKENYEMDMKGAGVGKGQFTFDYGDGICVVCDKGVTAYKKKDGSLAYSQKAFKNVNSYRTKGENVFLQNEKSDVAGIVIKDGTLKGIAKIKDSKWSKNEAFSADSEFMGGTDMTDDGEYLFTFKKKEIVKYKVNN